jgi:carbonic anhydrase
MKTTIVWAATACILFLAGGTSWAHLCEQGRNQSPVNISQTKMTDLSPLAFDYTGLITRLHNQEGQIRADYAAGSSLTVAGEAFALEYLSFHAPSEHQVEGQNFPLEVQLVHRNSQGQQLILAVLYDLGEENPALHRLWQQLPQEANTTVGMASRVRAEQFLPQNHAYYRVNGSLTSPPCSEGVLWLIMQEHGSLSEEQVQQFQALLGENNSRPVQALNARIILQSP